MTAVGAIPVVDVVKSAATPNSLRVVGLFAGIGGIEHGLHAAGHRSVLLNELDPIAQAVLRARFPETEVTGDVRELRSLPSDVDLVAAGFPCQDLSQAGRTAGIWGKRSGLVDEVFRLISSSRSTWLLLENVPFMLHLDGGRAMWRLTQELGRLGFRWAYRVVDARAFGVPQRRKRVILLASRVADPCSVLFADEAIEPSAPQALDVACGFYWTEGIRGLGWAVDAVPTLKGGSTIGIPSPPAVWMPDGLVGTPDIRDAERLQGFPTDWTEPAVAGTRRALGARWKMVGNAVCVPVATWIGQRLSNPGASSAVQRSPLTTGDRWPFAAYGEVDRAYRADASMWPVIRSTPHLAAFLQYPLHPLSIRATEGFLARTERSRLRFPDGFLPALRAYLEAALRSPSDVRSL